MGRVVALVLEVTQPGVAALALEQRLAELGQRFADELALGSEQLVEAASGGDWCEFHMSSARRARQPLVKASFASQLTFSECPRLACRASAVWLCTHCGGRGTGSREGTRLCASM